MTPYQKKPEEELEEEDDKKFDTEGLDAKQAKKLMKKEQKARQAERRVQKKELTTCFNYANAVMVSHDVKQMGEIKPGVSIKRIL